MTFKSHEQPRCRWCGKRIAKHTTHHFVDGSGYAFKEDNKIVTLDDINKTTNEFIVSVKYHYEKEEYEDLTPNEIYSKKIVRRTSGRRTIHEYTTWDGESYKDEFFCNGDHARNFGYAAACKGLAMPAYNKAVKGE